MILQITGHWVPQRLEPLHEALDVVLRGERAAQQLRVLHQERQEAHPKTWAGRRIQETTTQSPWERLLKER